MPQDTDHNHIIPIEKPPQNENNNIINHSDIDFENVENKNIENTDWSWLTYQYMIGFCITEFLFGLQQDGLYSRQIFATAFCFHFTTELQLTYYLFFTKKQTAKIMSIITFIMFTIQSILCFILEFRMVFQIFAAVFFVVDVASFIISMTIVFNLSKATVNYPLICRLCLVNILHFPGVLIGISTAVFRFHYGNSYEDGLGWITLYVSNVIQLIIIKPILQQNWKIPTNPLQITIIQQFMITFIIVIIWFCNIIVSLNRTTAPRNDSFRFANGWMVQVINCLPVFAIAVAFISTYWYKFSSQNTYELIKVH